MPNAGLPQRLEGRFIYAASAEYFGTVTPRLLAAGARIVGGCCGTTPEHIAAMRAVLDATEAPAARTTEGLATTAAPASIDTDRARTHFAHGSRASRSDRRRRAAPDAPSPSCSTPAASSSRSRSTRRGASGSSARSRPPGCSAMPASTSSTSPTRRWPGSG